MVNRALVGAECMKMQVDVMVVTLYFEGVGWPARVPVIREEIIDSETKRAERGHGEEHP
jgi:hypothetical protein